jgi:hypothetical protein
LSIPFLGCDFEVVYPILSNLIPSELISYRNWNIDVFTMAEIVCAGICHQINWDFLRNAVYVKLQEGIGWIYPHNLCNISTQDVEDMLNGYVHTERIRAKE